MKLIKFIAVTSERATVRNSNNVLRFLSWARPATDEQRANAAFALARAYLCSNLSDKLRREAGVLSVAKLDALRHDLETCLTALLEDESVLVRRALAEALVDASGAPRHIIITLAADLPEIAVIVLSKSRALSDVELIECATGASRAVERQQPLLTPAASHRADQNFSCFVYNEALY